MKTHLLKYSFLFLSLLIGFFPSTSAQEIKLNYVGSSTVANYIRQADPQYDKATFNINTEPESAGGEIAILEGRCDVAGVAKVPKAEILAKGIKSSLIGWDGIAVIVHPDNPINNLTVDELKSVFTGKVKNWKDLNGPDLPVKVFVVSTESATRNVFRSAVLGKANYQDCEIVKPDPEIIKKVQENPGAIGHISFSFLSPKDSIKRIAVEGMEPNVSNPSYPIKRPLYLLWWPGRSEISDFVDWTLGESGQQIIKRNFVGVSEGVISANNEKGTLIVYTPTFVTEEGGIYYYPHLPYEILNPDKTKVRRVQNHRDDRDETPDRIRLAPGSYIVKPEVSDPLSSEYYVTIEAGKTTTINLESDGFDDTTVQEPETKTDEGAEKERKLMFLGDFRFRVEHDWDSRNFDGSFRDDRSRMRYRLRFGFNYRWNEYVSTGARIRTGVRRNIQSPHMNVGYFGFSSVPFQVDQAYIAASYKSFWGWAGKKNLPFWKQNELWWDDDVNPEGISLGMKLDGKNFRLRPTFGFFVANHDHNGVLPDATIGAGQIMGEVRTGKAKIIAATGYYRFDNLYNVPESDDLFTGTRFRMDYNLVVSGLQFTWGSKIPIVLGVDHFTNLAEYGGDTLIDPVFSDEKDGFVGSILIGKQREKGDWLIGYYYAYKEMYSVISYYGEDDWVRWGNINRNRNTNYRGHEFRFAYNFATRINAVLRVYLVQGLKTNGLTTETGNRVRLDLNFKF